MNKYEKLVYDRLKYWVNCPLLEITDIQQQGSKQCCTALINDVEVFISYYTVIGFNRKKSCWFTTDRRYRCTTSKQMNQFFKYRPKIELEHEEYRRELADNLRLTDRQIENVT